MPDVWDFVCARKQVRKRDGSWELWIFQDRSWVKTDISFTSWTKVMWLATGDDSYRPANTYLVPQVVWQP